MRWRHANAKYMIGAMATKSKRQIEDDICDRLAALAREVEISRETPGSLASDGHERKTSSFVRDLALFHAKMVAKHGLLPDSTPLIREMRDEL